MAARRSFAPIVASWLSFAIPGLTGATSSENVCYRSDAATICFGWNGGERLCDAVFAFASPRLPLFLGLEREAARQGRHFRVQYGHFPQAVVLDDRPLDVGELREATELANALAAALGCEATPAHVVPAFSIQLELLPAGGDAATRRNELALRLASAGSDPGLISHEGDCDVSPIWSHRYPDGRVGIRYGLFSTFSAAWKDAPALGFDRARVQIVRTTLRADSLHAYFQARW